MELFLAVNRGDEKTVLALLNHGGSNIDSSNENGFTPLHNACSFGHPHIVKQLLAWGANIEATNNKGETPLHMACANGHFDVTNTLLDQGASFKATCKKGLTPLHGACMNGYLVVTQTLLDRGANIEARDKQGNTPLLWACDRGHFDVTKTLLDQGANIGARNNNGDTPLILACINDHINVIKELLRRGANVKAKNNYGNIPLDYAKTDEIRKILSDKNFSTNESKDKVSPFYKELFQEEHNGKHNVLLYKMEKLSQLVGDVHEMKLLYTMAMHCIRINALDAQFCKKCIKIGLDKTAETCTSLDAIVIYKIILKKARKDNVISEYDSLKFDNIAEVKRMSEADFIKDMKKAIEINTRRIDNLEHRTDRMENALYSVVEHIKYQRKVEAAVGFVCCIVNAFSFGIGGSLLKAFCKLTSNIVDFGDAAHIQEEIEVLIEHPDGTQEVTTGHVLSNPFEELKEEFLRGVDIVGDGLIEKDFKKVSSAMTAIGRAAALASSVPTAVDSFPVNSRIVIHDIPSIPELNGRIGYVQSELMDGHHNVLVDGYSEVVSLHVSNLKAFQGDCRISPQHAPVLADSNSSSKNNNDQIQTPSSSPIFPDATLSEEDENKFVLHCAVKYGDIEDIKKEIALVKDNINVCDSQGRTALDLAALTGQLEVMELISGYGGKFKYGPRPKMNAMAKKREPKFQQYLEQVHGSLE